jgi:Domain of unknown function (DUF397)
VDDGLSFERSSYCANSCCVEVAMVRQTGNVLVRNSQNPDAQIAFSAAEWRAFLAGVKSNEFDV